MMIKNGLMHLVKTMCWQLSAFTGTDFLIDCPAGSVSSVSYHHPELSIYHTVSEEAGMKMKGGWSWEVKRREGLMLFPF